MVELARAGASLELATRWSAITVAHAEQSLRCCIRWRCPEHGDDREALALLSELTDEADGEEVQP